MTLPKPGAVIKYAYLWAGEDRRGLREGKKDRPSLVVAVSISESEVLVLAITHTKPSTEDTAVELPTAVKRSLGLDTLPSWIVTNEANFFTWPGPDIRPARKGSPSATYGQIPATLLRKVATEVVENRKRQQLQLVRRTD